MTSIHRLEFRCFWGMAGKSHEGADWESITTIIWEEVGQLQKRVSDCVRFCSSYVQSTTSKLPSDTIPQFIAVSKFCMLLV